MAQYDAAYAQMNASLVRIADNLEALLSLLDTKGDSLIQVVEDLRSTIQDSALVVASNMSFTIESNGETEKDPLFRDQIGGI